MLFYSVTHKALCLKTEVFFFQVNVDGNESPIPMTEGYPAYISHGLVTFYHLRFPKFKTEMMYDPKLKKKIGKLIIVLLFIKLDFSMKNEQVSLHLCVTTDSFCLFAILINIV